MKALEIYLQDFDAREDDAELQPRQQYYSSLRDAMYDELLRDGYCEMLERLYLACRDGDMTRLYVVDYAALMECHSMIVAGRAMRDATTHIPHLMLRGKKVEWAMLEAGGAHSVPVSKEICSSLRELRSVCRQMADARDDSFTQTDEGASRREMESVHALNKILDERCQNLARERDELLARLQELEDGVISEQVGFSIENRRREEEEALQALYAEKRAEAHTVFQQEYARLVGLQQARQLDADRAAAALQAADAARQGDLRQRMAEDVRGLQTLLQQHIARWEGDMHLSDCRMLARSYTGLHALLTGPMAETIVACGTAEAGEPTMAALVALQHQLHEQILRLEQALLRLGLKALRPQEGDAFDPDCHSTEDGAASGVITCCLCPGVAAASGGVVLEKALVRMKMT